MRERALAVLLLLAVFALALAGCGISSERIHLVVRDSRSLIRAGEAKHEGRRAVWQDGADAALPNLDRLWEETGGAEEDAREDAAIAAVGSAR